MSTMTRMCEEGYGWCLLRVVGVKWSCADHKVSMVVRELSRSILPLESVTMISLLLNELFC